MFKGGYQIIDLRKLNPFDFGSETITDEKTIKIFRELFKQKEVKPAIILFESTDYGLITLYCSVRKSVEHLEYMSNNLIGIRVDYALIQNVESLVVTTTDNY